MPRPFMIPDKVPADLARALEVFRRPAYLLILIAMKDHPDQAWFLADLSKASGVSVNVLGKALPELEAIGVIHADPGPGERWGRSVRYSLDLEQYSEAVEAWVRFTTPEARSAP